MAGRLSHSSPARITSSCSPLSRILPIPSTICKHTFSSLYRVVLHLSEFFDFLQHCCQWLSAPTYLGVELGGVSKGRVVEERGGGEQAPQLPFQGRR